MVCTPCLAGLGLLPPLAAVVLAVLNGVKFNSTTLLILAIAVVLSLR